MTRLLLLTLCLLLVTACATGGAQSKAAGAGDPVLGVVVRDLCDREVAALGETAGHGDGKTIAFKAALVERLVEEYGFDAVFFEGSSYDFLELERRERRGEAVTREMVASAVGGLWNRYVEMQALIDFLHRRSTAMGLRLGGFDDQLGSAGAFYSISAMPAELSGLLSEPRAGQCRETLRKRIYGETGTSPAERAPLKDCLRKIRAAVEDGGAGADREERLHMIGNIERYAARDWADDAAHSRARDRSMWINYRWLMGRLLRGSKVILWGASVHLSRDARASPAFPAGGNFGAYLHRLHGDRIFFLGFAAGEGDYLSGGSRRRIEPKGAGSLEAAALAGSGANVAYLEKAALRRLGRRPGGVFERSPISAEWSEIMEGVVVFRQEHPPETLPRS